MKRLVEFFVNRYVATFSLFGVLCLFGVISYFGIGVDLYPKLTIPIVSVTTAYPGAGSQEVAEQITKPLERELSTLGGLTNLTSTSSEGVSIIIAEFEARVNENQAAVDVGQKVNGVVGTLPTGTRAPVVQKYDATGTPILYAGIAASGEDLTVVKSYAETTLLPELQRVNGVASVTVLGSPEREIQVLLDPAKLASYDLSPTDVTGAIAASAVDIPIGTLTFSDSRVILTGRNSPKTLEAVLKIAIDSARGIHVSDVASVRDTASDVQTYTRINGEAVVLLSVQKTPKGNSVATADAFKAKIKELELPQGYTIKIVNDSTAFTKAVVKDTFHELIVSTIAVALVIIFFVGRLGTILAVLLAIPVSIAGAIIVFGLFGFTFNLITLLAITVAVGLVVDDAIVVAENIDRYREKGYPVRQAVIEGAGEVSTPVLAATLSLLAVFLPISFLPGVIGQFFKEFGIAMTAMIAVSYLEAMFFLTVRLALAPDPMPPTWSEFAGTPLRFAKDARWTLAMLKKPWLWFLVVGAGVALYFVGGFFPVAFALLLPVVVLLLRYLGRIVIFFIGAVLRTIYEVGNVVNEKVRQWYVASLRTALGRPWLVLGVAAALLGSLVFIAPSVGFNFSGRTDTGLVVVNLNLPTGTLLQQTNTLVTKVENEIKADPLVSTVLTFVGSQDAEGNTRTENAQLSVQLVPKHDRTVSSYDVAPQWQEKFRTLLKDFPEAKLEVIAEGSGDSATGGGYTLTLVSTNLDLLREREGAIRRVLEGNKNLQGVSSSMAANTTERILMVNEDYLTGSGITATDLYNTLRIYKTGEEATKLRAGGSNYPIRVMGDPKLLQGEDALLSLPIKAPGLETQSQIGQFGHFETRATPATINRSNQVFSLTLRGNLAPDSPPLLTVRSEVEEALKAQNLIDSRVTVSKGSGLDLLGDLVKFAPIAFALALLLNYLVIASQFNSFRFPLYLQLTVPLAFIGVFWLFFVTGAALDVISVLGIVMLIGLVVKNAILLLEVLLEKVGHAASLKEAMLEAASVRFRPIVMTTMTVVIISVPLLLGIGEGSEFRYPLGLVILGGVLTSALLTFYVVPAAFYQFERKKFERDASQKGTDTSHTPDLPRQENQQDKPKISDPKLKPKIQTVARDGQ